MLLSNLLQKHQKNTADPNIASFITTIAAGMALLWQSISGAFSDGKRQGREYFGYKYTNIY